MIQKETNYTDQHIIFRNLQPYEEYCASVQARTRKGGYGPKSKPVCLFTEEGGKRMPRMLRGQSIHKHFGLYT